MTSRPRFPVLAATFLVLGSFTGGCSCGASDEAAAGSTTTGGAAGAAGASGSSQAGSSQAGSSQAGSSQAGSSQAGSSQAGSSQAGSSQAGSSQAGSSQAGSSQAGSSQAGSSQAGSSQGGAGAAGSSQAGSAQAGSAQAGSAGSAQAGSSQAGSAGSAQAGSSAAGAGGGAVCGTGTGGIAGSLDPNGAGVGVGTNLGPWVIDPAAKNRSAVADVAWASDGTAFILGTYTGTTKIGDTTLGPADARDLFVARMDLSTGTAVWVKSFADTGGAEDVIAHRLRVDASDAVYVLADGFMGTSVDFGGGSIGTTDQFSVLAAKLDATGAHVWSKALGGASQDTGRAIALHPAGGVVIGFGEAFKVNDLGTGPLLSYVLARLDDAGAVVWAQGDGPKGGGVKTTLKGLGVDAAGNVVFGGGLHDNLDDGCGGYLTVAEPTGVWAKRVDAMGAPLWARVWKAAGGEAWANDVAVDAVGNAYLVGTNTHQLDLGGGPLAGAGTTGSQFVGKLDPAGNHLWSHSFAGTPTGAFRATVDASGNLVVSGDCSGESYLDGQFPGFTQSCNLNDVFVTKWSPTGAPVWSHVFGDSYDQLPGGVAWSAGRGVLFGGNAKAQSLDLGAGPFSTDIDGISYTKGFAIRFAD